MVVVVIHASYLSIYFKRMSQRKNCLSKSKHFVKNILAQVDQICMPEELLRWCYLIAYFNKVGYMREQDCEVASQSCMHFDNPSIKRKKLYGFNWYHLFMLWVVHAMFYFGVKSNMSKGHVTDRGYQPIACEWLTLLEVGWLKR